MKAHVAALPLLLILAAACTKTERAPDTETPSTAAAEAAATTEDAPAEAPADDADAQDDGAAEAVESAESSEILARAPVAEHVMVQHVLLSWDAKGAFYEMRGGQDARGAERSHAEAVTVAKRVVERVGAGEDFSALMRELSEDPGSARTGREYAVNPHASLVEPFKTLSLRLELNEAGIVETDFGYHVIYRTQ